MDAQELHHMSLCREVKITLHLPDYEGMKLLLVGGAITTPERFATFDPSLCHLDNDGTILRYGEQIGTIADIEILNIIDVPNEDSTCNVSALDFSHRTA